MPSTPLKSFYVDVVEATQERPLAAPTVTVFRDGTSTQATLFADAQGLVSLSNPISVNPARFFADEASVSVRVVKGSYSYRIDGILPTDHKYNVFALPADFGIPVLLPSYTLAGLPPAGTAGRLARVTDDVRGVWVDTGTAWIKVAPFVDAEDFSTLQAAVDAAKASTLYKEVRLAAKTYSVNNVTEIFRLTDANGVRIIGQGVENTILQQQGTGNGVEIAGTSEIVGLFLKGFKIDGNNTGAIGLELTNIKDSVIEQVNVVRFKNHAIDVPNPVGSVHVTLRDMRNSGPSPGTTAVAGARMLNLRGGNLWRSEYNYWNGGNQNPNTSGTGYDTAIDVRGHSEFTSIGDTFDGVQFGIRASGPLTVVSPRFDFTTPAPGAISKGVFMQGNATTVLITPFGAAASFLNLVELDVGISRKYLSIIGANDGEHGSVIAGMLSGSVISPAQIIANQNDYAPTNGAFSLFWQISTTDAERTITGIADGFEGRILILRNTGIFNIVLAHEDVGSVAANRINLMTEGMSSFVLSGNSRRPVVLIYSDSRWRVMGGPDVLHASATFDAQNLVADGDVTATTITITGAELGDPCAASLSSIGANNVLLSAQVSAANTVRIILMNKTGGAIDLASGTLRATVWKQRS